MKRIKLHTKFLILLTGVSLVPLIIVSSFTLARFQQSLYADASSLGEQLAATASAQIKTFLVSQFGILDNVAAIYDPGFPIQKDVADKILEVILLKSENFQDISIVDKYGKEIARKNRLLIIAPDDLRDMSSSDQYHAVVERGIYVGPVYVDSGRSYFNVSREIFGSKGEFVGAVFAQVDARIMSSVVKDISLIVGPQGRVYIVNEKGIVIAHPDPSYMLAQRDLSNLPLVNHIIVAPDTLHPSITYINELEESVLGATYPMTIELGKSDIATPSINWFVIVEQPEARVYADAQSARLFSVLILLATMIFAAGAAFFFSGAIVRPIEALHTAAIEFGKGNLGYRAKVQTRDEIGDLADSFNATADALANTVQSLKNEQHVTSAERNKLSVILSGITSAVVAVNMDRKIILFNKAAETLVGVTTESVLGSSLGEVLHLFDRERALSVEEICPIQPEAPEGIVFKANNLKMKDASGVEHFVNVISGRIREGESIDLGCVLTFQDITREFIMERTKHEFVTIAAHQLRTPLTGMSWTVETLLSETKGALNAAQKELVGRGLGAIHRMVELVNDLLDVSRIEEGRFGIKLARQSLAPVFSRVTDMFKKAAQERGIEFVTEISPTLPEFEFDASKVELVINNILDNAVRYTPEGGHIAFRAVQKDNDVVISMKDTGIGISRADVEHVFKKFFRSREAFSHFTDGSGLGLYVARNIMNQHGGKIWFESDEGKGTTFYVSLPLSRALMPNAS